MQTTEAIPAPDPSQDPTQGQDPTALTAGGGADQQFMSPDDMGGGDMGGGDAGAPPTLNDPNDQGGDFDPNSMPGHSSFMGGVDSQHPGSDQMLAEDDTAVSPEEQQAYDDFVTRGLMFLNDTRKPLGKNGKPNENAKSPADTIISHLNVRGFGADQAVGRTTAQICWLIFSNAQHQGVKYPPDVVYHGADEIMSHVYEIGVQSGAIKNPPPPDSPQEQHLLGMAKMYACQYFGNNVIDSGLNNQDEAKQFYQQQMQREADSGSLDHWDPRQDMSPGQLSDFLARASSGKAALADMRKGPPQSISDYQQRGAPSLLSSYQNQQQAPPAEGDQGDQGGGEEAPPA